MTVQITWDNAAQTILRYQFEADWQWDDLYRAIHDGMRLADGRYTEIDTIFEASDLRVPSGNMLFHARRLLDQLPPQRGMIVIVSKQPLLRNVVAIINQVYKTTFISAYSLEEARDLIARHRASFRPAPSGDPAEMLGCSRCPSAGDRL